MFSSSKLAIFSRRTIVAKRQWAVRPLLKIIEEISTP